MKHVDLSTVRDVDVRRYLGRWYEIARFNHSFERGMVGVSADYSLNNNGTIKVVNRGYKGALDGKLKQITGKAKIPNPKDSGKLRVSFFLFFYSDYYVLELDKENYAYALVGSSSSTYLWILSRTPQLSKVIIDELLRKAEKRGFDVSKLIWVEQSTVF